MTRLQSAPKAVDAGNRVPDYLLPPRAPIVLAYGVGVDSTALLCGESIISYGAGG